VSSPRNVVATSLAIMGATLSAVVVLPIDSGLALALAAAAVGGFAGTWAANQLIEDLGLVDTLVAAVIAALVVAGFVHWRRGHAVELATLAVAAAAVAGGGLAAGVRRYIERGFRPRALVAGLQAVPIIVAATTILIAVDHTESNVAVLAFFGAAAIAGAITALVTPARPGEVWLGQTLVFAAMYVAASEGPLVGVLPALVGATIVALLGAIAAALAGACVQRMPRVELPVARKR
jgi:hypothetical protein